MPLIRGVVAGNRVLALVRLIVRFNHCLIRWPTSTVYPRRSTSQTPPMPDPTGEPAAGDRRGPFASELVQAMREHRVTFRALAERSVEVDPNGRGLTATYINQIAT